MASRSRPPGRFLRSTPFLTYARNLLAAASCLAVGCAAPRPGEPLPRYRDEISVCGDLFHTGTRVVLWEDPWGYDAYRVEPRFPAEMNDKERAEWKPQACYHTIRGGVSDAQRAGIEDHGWELDWLREHIDLFVIHFDVCGTSRQCFKVLHDERHLSVHFMLDVDGTIYQTLDLKERAWHAAEANDRSIGVEIAQVGAYDSPHDEKLRTWYPSDDRGPFIQPPAWMRPGFLTPNFVGRPSRPDLLSGRIQNKLLYQYDFTDQQYAALAKLTATLLRVFPNLKLAVPRDKNGAIVEHALSSKDLAAYHGILGHYHVTDQKFDPGPAFDWERLLRQTRADLPVDSVDAATAIGANGAAGATGPHPSTDAKSFVPLASTKPASPTASAPAAVVPTSASHKPTPTKSAPKKGSAPVKKKPGS